MKWREVSHSNCSGHQAEPSPGPGPHYFIREVDRPTGAPDDGRPIAPQWRDCPPQLPLIGEGTSRAHVLLLVSLTSRFWEVLAYGHLAREAEAEIARERCREAANDLRRAFDGHPDIGPDAIDAVIAWRLYFARKRFADDLTRECFYAERRGKFMPFEEMPNWRQRLGTLR